MALAAVLLVMAAVNVWVHLGPRRTQAVTGPLAAALLLLIGSAAGLSLEDMGLGVAALSRGAGWGALLAAAVALAYAAAAAVPRARPLFRDTRYRLGPRAALRTALVTVPLATVVFEEVAFRGVLWALLEQDHGAGPATLVSSLLFGAWHVLPAVHLARTNLAVGTGGGRVGWTVLGTVAFTTVAGLLFAELRRRTGSLLAPVLLHWATNGIGVLVSARVWASSRDGSGG